MIRMMSTASQAMALPRTAQWTGSGEVATVPQRGCEEMLAIPARGILWGMLMSSCLWAVLIVGGRALWQLLR